MDLYQHHTMQIVCCFDVCMKSASQFLKSICCQHNAPEEALFFSAAGMQLPDLKKTPDGLPGNYSSYGFKSCNLRLTNYCTSFVLIFFQTYSVQIFDTLKIPGQFPIHIFSLIFFSTLLSASLNEMVKFVYIQTANLDLHVNFTNLIFRGRLACQKYLDN